MTDDERAARRREVIMRYARQRDGHPIFCTPSRAERYGLAPRRAGKGTDGKPLYDTREIAEAAARELEALGADPMRAYRCGRMDRRGHFHLTRDSARRAS